MSQRRTKRPKKRRLSEIDDEDTLFSPQTKKRRPNAPTPRQSPPKHDTENHRRRAYTHTTHTLEEGESSGESEEHLNESFDNDDDLLSNSATPPRLTTKERMGEDDTHIPTPPDLISSGNTSPRGRKLKSNSANTARTRQQMNSYQTFDRVTKSEEPRVLSQPLSSPHGSLHTSIQPPEGVIPSMHQPIHVQPMHSSISPYSSTRPRDRRKRSQRKRKRVTPPPENDSMWCNPATVFMAVVTVLSLFYAFRPPGVSEIDMGRNGIHVPSNITMHSQCADYFMENHLYIANETAMNLICTKISELNERCERVKKACESDKLEVEALLSNCERRVLPSSEPSEHELGECQVQLNQEIQKGQQFLQSHKNCMNDLEHYKKLYDKATEQLSDLKGQSREEPDFVARMKQKSDRNDKFNMSET